MYDGSNSVFIIKLWEMNKKKSHPLLDVLQNLYLLEKNASSILDIS